MLNSPGKKFTAFSTGHLHNSPCHLDIPVLSSPLMSSFTYSSLNVHWSHLCLGLGFHCHATHKSLSVIYWVKRLAKTRPQQLFLGRQPQAPAGVLLFWDIFSLLCTSRISNAIKLPNELSAESFSRKSSELLATQAHYLHYFPTSIRIESQGNQGIKSKSAAHTSKQISMRWSG